MYESNIQDMRLENSKIQYNSDSPLLITLVIVGILLSTDFYSYIYYFPRRTYHLLLGIIYIVTIFHYKKKYHDTFLDYTVMFTVLSIFLSIIPAVVDYNQDYLPTLMVCFCWNYCLLLYFIFKRSNISTKNLVIVVSTFSVLWVFLELFQQFTYPDFLFSQRFKIVGFVQERMGLWRFYILGVDFVMLAFAYWLGETDNKKRQNYYSYLFSAVFLVGLLCYGSRKHIYTILFTLSLFAFWTVKGGRNRVVKIVLVVCFLLFLYINFYGQWVDLNESAALSQGEGEDFIRYMSAKYYLFDFSDSNLYPIFGAGLPVDGSSLESKLSLAHNMFGDKIGFWQADIGILGYYSMFGALGVSAIVMYICFFIYNWKYIDTWLKIFFIMKMILIVFDFWAMWNSGMTVYAIFLYLLDKNVRQNKAKMRFKMLKSEY